MPQQDPTEARRYHEQTKHSFESVRVGGHYLDWENRPDPFKRYRGVEAIPLPEDPPSPEVTALDAIAVDPHDDAIDPKAEHAPQELALPDLARILRWGAGAVRTRDFPGGETYHFRTYASAGALYPVELYVACADVPGIAAGLYHFHPLELALRPLRGTDVRDALAKAAADRSLAGAAAVLLLTGIMWRSAWKYEARAYRHLYWDAGTMLANLLALAASAGLERRLITGFVDDEVNRLLGVDGEREAALALLAVGRAEATEPTGGLEPLSTESDPLSAREKSYPEASGLHAASGLAHADEVRAYSAASNSHHRPARDAVKSLPPAETAGLSREPLEAVIRRRGSARDFAPDPVPASELRALLARAMSPIPSDFPATIEIRLFANALEGLEPGAYRFASPDRFEEIRLGNFRAEAGYLALEQALAARAAATLFFMAELEQVLATLGNRGYRAAQLEAGIRAGRVYLGAYAQGLGATGLTFYDDEVTEFLAPGTTKSPMLCVALGVDARRRRLRESALRRTRAQNEE
jgi:SagB-type dehydrogenase family enzyme